MWLTQLKSLVFRWKTDLFSPPPSPSFSLFNWYIWQVRAVKNSQNAPLLLLFDSYCLRKRTAAAAKSLQSCSTLCDPIDGRPPGSTVPGILQARTLEWVDISFSNAWKWKVKVKSLSRVQLLVIPWTAAYQAPSSMDLPGKSTGVGCHCLLPCLL